MTIPEGTKKEQFARWIENLPRTESPMWLGLPDNAETLLLSNQGKEVLRKLLKLQTTVEDTGSISTDLTGQQKGEDKRPAWMVNLRAASDTWLKALPSGVALLERTAENIKNPLFRFFERELTSSQKLLKRVRNDLQELIQVCDGNQKQTNNTRSLISSLSKGIVPSEWKKFAIPSYVSINAWIADFTARLKQLDEIRKLKDFGRSSIWIGGLLVAEAYITATRQAAAQANSWSLENLEIEAEILPSAENVTVGATSFVAKGMTLEGACWKNGQLNITNDIVTPLPAVKFTWKLKDNKADNSQNVSIPVYLNDVRAEFLFSVDLKVPSDTPKTMWHQRCISLTTWRANM